MSELQADAIAEETTEAVETEQPVENQASDSAPDTAGQPEEQITFSEEQQQHINDILGKKTFKMRELERQAEKEREEYQQRISELEAKIPQSERPEVPAMPDPYDDDFAEKVAQRDQVMREQIAFDEAKKAQAQLKTQQDQQAQFKKQQAFAEKVSTYSERAVKHGIAPEELQQAGQVVGSFGVKEDVVNHILSDEKGPLITKYLANSANELDKVSRMGPMQAAVYIETVIKPKAEKLGVKPPSAPEPVDDLADTGVAYNTRGAKGATYE